MRYTFDSREVKPGMGFIALKGEKADGHDFIPKALAAGAAEIVDGLEELQRRARDRRRMLKAKVIALTGSAGKTTTKELLKAFLSTVGRTYATEGNFNNHIGLPLTILNCPDDVDYLVLEMGTNHPGEIKYLVDIAEPEIGLVSSIGTAHIEFFKTQDGIAREKGVLFSDLRVTDRSFAVLAKENDRYDLLRGLSAAPVETVSLADPAAARLADALRVRLPGRHNVSNALIALACATRLGVSEDACLAALKGFSLPGGRWRVVERDGATYVDDTYNANPTSMVAALETFASLEVKGRRIAVIGDMFELGEQSAALHAQVKARAAELPLDRVILVGENMGGVDRDAAKAELAALVRPGDAVLLKASHGMHLDELLK